MGARYELAQMARLAWPATLSFVSFSLMEVVDCALLSSVGVDSMAGAALAATVLYLTMAFPLNMLRAFAPIAAGRAGRTGSTGIDRRSLTRLARLAALASLLLGGVAGALALGGGAGLSRFGYDPSMVASAQVFLAWRAPAVMLDLLFMAGWVLLDGLSDTRTPLLAGILSNLCNLGLNLVLIPGWGPIPALGVLGAALSTNLASLLGLLVVAGGIWARIRAAPGRLPGVSAASGDGPSELGRFVSIGWPMGVGGLLEVGGTLLFGLLIARLGAAAAAIFGVLSRVVALGLSASNGLSVAVTARVARALGRRESETAMDRARLALSLQVLVGSGVAVLAGLAGYDLMGWLSPDLSVLSTGLALLPLAAAVLWFEGLQVVGAAVLEGSGRTRRLLLLCLPVDLGAVLFLLLGFQASLEVCMLVWLGRAVLKAGLILTALPLTARAQEPVRGGEGRAGRTWDFGLSVPAAGRSREPEGISPILILIRWRWWSRPLPDG